VEENALIMPFVVDMSDTMNPVGASEKVNVTLETESRYVKDVSTMFTVTLGTPVLIEYPFEAEAETLFPYSDADTSA
jgi:hypothetical protein